MLTQADLQTATGLVARYWRIAAELVRSRSASNRVLLRDQLSGIKWSLENLYGVTPNPLTSEALDAPVGPTSAA